MSRPREGDTRWLFDDEPRPPSCVPLFVVIGLAVLVLTLLVRWWGV